MNKEFEVLKQEAIFANFPILSTKEGFESEYAKNSIPSFRELYCLDPRYFCELYGIKPRTASESSCLLSKEKFKKTCLERYGVENVLSKESPFFEKRNKTVFERYGVQNIFQLKDIIEKIQNDDYYIEKYGCTRSEIQSNAMKAYWANLTDDERQKRIELSVHKNWVNAKDHKFLNGSKLEGHVAEKLTEMGITFTQQLKLQYENEKGQTRNFYYDFFIQDFNLIIEVNGDYWHCNPKKYAETDTVYFFKHECLVKDIWERDKRKRKVAEDRGFRFIVLWEDELNKDIKDLLLQKLGEFI